MSEQENKTETTASSNAVETDAVGANTEINAEEKSEWTSEDLIDLIRAVKFSNKDASIRAVHNEISTKMASNESFEFLANVKLNDVKKVWKKALSGAGAGAGSSAGEKASSTASSLVPVPPAGDSDNSILKFYTVGDGSVQTLAKSYTMKAAAAVATQEDKEMEEELKNYVHCFLNVPADRSGSKPHQALVNFNDTKNGGGKKKGGKAKTKGHSVVEDADGREIVKIQTAAAMPGTGMENIKTVMLLYNSTRTARTFVHPDEDDEGSYDKIRDLIINNGVTGVLSDGGTKAYFYCRITTRQDGEDIVSVDVSELAPTQKW